ncbi:WD repeat-containing protein 46-like [Amphiura filiformis]|uniref:WD repeat-containing protein 46-like n=1 Tax=Amphiura filiformis TaxID=82378 RepID=UPI003B219D8C
MKPKKAQRYFVDEEKQPGSEEVKSAQDSDKRTESHKPGPSQEKSENDTRTSGRKEHTKRRTDKHKQEGHKHKRGQQSKDGKAEPHWKQEEEIELYDDDEFRSIENRSDQFEGDAPVPVETVERYERGKKNKLNIRNKKLKEHLQKKEEKFGVAAKQAARAELLLPEDSGFLEADEGDETHQILQTDLVDAVDITSATKSFELNLPQFGPYHMDFTRNGRFLLLGGKMGHLAGMDWITKNLMFEINVMETIRDVQWLHQETMLAVSQKKWVYMYDNQGTELHCIKKMNDVLKMEFLPYHFLLATCNANGFLQYLDTSVGKMVAQHVTKCGRLDVMTQNPYNAIIHLGHPNGTVTLWSPNVKEPLVKMLCHKMGIRAVAVDKSGLYMATSGMDRQLKIFDVRTFKPLQAYRVPYGAGDLCFSQRGLLAAACGNVVEVYKDCCRTTQKKPYMRHRMNTTITNIEFSPYEDVLGVAHAKGYASLLIPGAGEANFDALEANPYQNKTQRREFEVKALLEKIQPEMITLDPNKISEIDEGTMKQRKEERMQIFGIVPKKVSFEPTYKMRGKSKGLKNEQRKQGKKEAYRREQIREEMNEKQKEKRFQKQEEGRHEELDGQPRHALDRFRKK